MLLATMAAQYVLPAALLFRPVPVSAATLEEWTSDVQISHEPADPTLATQRGSIVERTSTGDFIVIWQDQNAGHHYARKIDVSGGLLWAGPVQLTNQSSGDFFDVVADGSGGAFHMYVSGGNLYVNHIDQSGTIWQINGVQVFNDQINDAETMGTLLHDGSGGVYAAWPVNRTATRFVEVTRLNSSGAVHASWNTGGSGTFRPVEFSDTVSGIEPRVIDGGSGDIIVTYEGSSNSVVSRKLDADGGAVWGPISTTNAQGIDGWMTVADGVGGAYVGFNSFSNFPYDMKIRRLAASDGSTLWTTTTGSSNNFAPYPHMTADASGVIMFWNHEDDGTGDVDVYGQKLNTGGVAQWNGGSMLAVANAGNGVYSETLLFDVNQSIVPDGNGGAFIGFVGVGATIDVSGVQYVKSDGTKDFGSNGHYLGEDTWYTSLAPDGSGGVVVTWTGKNEGVDADYDIWGQRLTSVVVEEGAIEIHIVDNGTGSVETTGVGISNGNDAGTLADIDFAGAPTLANGNVSGAQRYSFSSDVPTQSSVPLDFENLSGTEFLASVSGVLNDQDDDESKTVPLGFTTKIYGRDVDTVKVTSNGLVYLNSSANIVGTDDGCCAGFGMTDYANLPASVNGTATGDILIAGKWTDLNPSGDVSASVRYTQDGTYPNRRFVITFENVEYFDPDTVQNDFQIKILESAPAASNDPTLDNSVTLSRLKAGESATVDISFSLQNTLSGPLTVTFPAGFTVTAAATGGASSGCLSSFGFTAQTLIATKTSCSGAVTLGGATVTNPGTPGTYTISWVNDDPGEAQVFIVDDDQVNVSGAVDAELSFNVGSQAAATDCDGTFSGNGGAVALGALTTGAVASSDVASVPHICTRLTTNAGGGATVSVTSANAALASISAPADAIASGTATLVAGTEGYGICVGSGGTDTGEDVTSPAGASPVRSSPFNGTCGASDHAVGGLTTALQNVWTLSGASQNAFARIYVKAAIDPTTAAHDDYADTLTFVATAEY